MALGLFKRRKKAKAVKGLFRRAKIEKRGRHMAKAHAKKKGLAF